jgi:hypothetical protein
MAASYGYGPEGAPRHLNAQEARSVPRLELPAQRLGELLAVVEGVLCVPRKPVSDREPAAFSVLSIARKIFVFKVLQHGE